MPIVLLFDCNKACLWSPVLSQSGACRLNSRRTFVGLLYNQIQDPNLISSMSGHVEGSREFARYRKIEREAKKKAVDLIN